MSERTIGAGPRDSVTARLARLNWIVLGLLCVLAAIGVAALYSVADGAFSPWAERHAMRFVIGLAVVLAMAVTPLAVWYALAYPAYLVALVCLALVPLIGVEAGGAKRWIAIAGVNFQPSEVMKIALVMMLARYYQSLPAARLSAPLFVALPAAAIALPVLLTLIQPDLGTALLFVIVGFGMMFMAGVSIFYFAGALASGLAALPVLYGNLHEYQRQRIATFLDPESDPLGSGYHIMQSKIALASGGLTGRGYMQGTQSQLDFLPEKHTDFIFTLIGEEFGFIGGLVILVLFLALLLVLLWMAARTESRFGRGLISGMALVLSVYVMVNVAMVSGLIPVVGVPLPLVSYGGTSMMTFMVGFGLAMSGAVDRVHRRSVAGTGG